MTAFLMPDVSHYQSTLTPADVQKVKKVAGAIMLKATDGTSFTDPNYVQNTRACDREGFPYGAYHYVEQGQGAQQADHFWYVVNRTKAKFICIDWEKGDRQTAKDFVARIKTHTKLPLGGYFGAWARQFGGPLSGCDWAMVPDYGPAHLLKVYYPRPYELTAWQYTDGPINGTNMPSNIPGIGPCDVSVVYHPENLGLQGDDDVAFSDFKEGVKDKARGKDAKHNAPDDYSFGYNLETRVEKPSGPGGPLAPHTHDLSKTGGVTP